MTTILLYEDAYLNHSSVIWFLKVLSSVLKLIYLGK